MGDVDSRSILSKAACEALIKYGRKYRKISITEAVQIGTHFAVETAEGALTASAGDWLAKDAKGDFYPISADVFRETYRPYRSRNPKKVKDVVPSGPENG